MKIITLKKLQELIAEFVENGCYVETPNEIEEFETLYDWLEGHDYIPIGKIKLKHANDDKRFKELDAYDDLFEKFDADYYDEPFNRLLLHCLQEAAGDKEINEFPIMTGFTPYNSDEMEIRLEI